MGAGCRVAARRSAPPGATRRSSDGLDSRPPRPMHPALPDRLRELRALLHRAAVGEDVAPAPIAAAIARLDRDLLPRTAGGSAHLVVGVVGPNNAGKSALFNALVGRALSPSAPTGGATRRLLGAAHPELRARLESEPTLARFPVRGVTPGPLGVEAATAAGGDAAELLLVEDPGLPPDLLLVDTPDFDSVHVENRAASESLLRVADLAVVVVTRHTYQNKEVVDFLETWLAHGRPWLLVYNESLGTDVTRAHAAKLAEDLASPPVAVFQAPFDLAVAEGRAVLAPRELDGGGGELRPWLFEMARTRELKRAALAASLAQLRDELTVLVHGAAASGADAARLLALADERAERLGRDVAAGAMPMGPFLDAFRAVLDRRPGLLPRGYRGLLRRARLAAQGALARLPWRRRAQPRPDTAALELIEVERKALAERWPVFFEELARALREGARNAPAEWRAALDADLASDRLAPAGLRAAAALDEDPEVLRAFREACEQRIEVELDERGGEWFFQIAVDALHLLPALAAGVVIVKTGGLGVDVAVGGAGALSSLLAERLSKLLGTQVAHAARERWTRLRGARLGQLLCEAALPGARPMLARSADDGARLARALESWMEETRWQS